MDTEIIYQENNTNINKYNCPKNKKEKNRKDSKIRTERIGEVNTNNQGMLMKILAYRSSADIDIIFEDGTQVTGKTYRNFKYGSIACPSAYNLKRVGEKNTNNQGFEMEIVSYRTPMDIDVKFESGDKIIGRTYYEFKKGKIKCPSEYRLKRVGQKNINNHGFEMQIIAYRKNNDIDVEFETGDRVIGTTYRLFKQGEIKCPSEYRLKRVGQKNINKHGLEMEIVAYRKSNDIDVQFKNGKIRTTRYKDFKEGCVKCPE